MSNEQRLFNLLTDKSVKFYIHFLKFVLNYFNSFNALFHSKHLMIHKLHSIVKIMQKISINFISDAALSSISDTDFDIEKNFKPLNEMYLDPSCSEIMKTLPSDVS